MQSLTKQTGSPPLKPEERLANHESLDSSIPSVSRFITRLSCHRTFRSRIGLTGHRRRQCANNPATPATAVTADRTVVDSPPSTTDIIRPTLAPAPTTATSTANTTTPRSHLARRTTSDALSPATIAISKITTFSDVEMFHTCSNCDRTFAAHIGRLGHLRIYRTETDEPVPWAPTCTSSIRFKYPHCPEQLFATWAYWIPCAFMETCGRKLPATPRPSS
ncbi:hypothetical protein SprV_0100249800 [Sparganum proliferum]